MEKIENLISVTLAGMSDLADEVECGSADPTDVATTLRMAHAEIQYLKARIVRLEGLA